MTSRRPGAGDLRKPAAGRPSASSPSTMKRSQSSSRPRRAPSESPAWPAERDRGGLHDAVALHAKRQLAAQERLADRIQLVAMAEVQAARIGRVAVQLDDLGIGHAGALMQAVDILCDDSLMRPCSTSLASARWPASGSAVEHRLVGANLRRHDSWCISSEAMKSSKWIGLKGPDLLGERNPE